MIEELLTGSPYEWLLQHVKLRESTSGKDAHSLTLTDSSKSSRHARRGQPHQARQSQESDLDRNNLVHLNSHEMIGPEQSGSSQFKYPY